MQGGRDVRKQAPMPKYCFGDYATHTSAD